MWFDDATILFDAVGALDIEGRLRVALEQLPRGTPISPHHERATTDQNAFRKIREQNAATTAAECALLSELIRRKAERARSKPWTCLGNIAGECRR